MAKSIMTIDDGFNPIITKAGDINELGFKTITEKELQEINECSSGYDLA